MASATDEINVESLELIVNHWTNDMFEPLRAGTVLERAEQRAQVHDMDQDNSDANVQVAYLSVHRVESKISYF